MLAWIDELDMTMLGIRNRYGHLYYNGFRKGQIDTEAVNALSRQYNSVICDPGIDGRIQELLADNPDRTAKRKAELLVQMAARERVDGHPALSAQRTDILSMESKFKPSVFGKATGYSERSALLTGESDRSIRKEAYHSLLPLLSDIEEASHNSIKLANELASKEGFASYFDFLISFDELNPDSLKKTFRRILEKTSEDYSEFLDRSRREINSGDLYTSDLSYTQERITEVDDSVFPKQRLIDTLKETLRSFSIDFDSLPVRIEEFDTPYAGTCFVLGADDIRLVMNPDNGYFSYYVLFHEFGHAMHYAYQPAGSVLLRDGGMCSEAIADTVAAVIDEPDWLAAFTDMTDTEISTYLFKRKLSDSFRIRSFIRDTVFEIEIHRNPDIDFSSAWKEITEMFLQVHVEEPVWSPFSVYRPAYTKNYVYSQIIQSGIVGCMHREYGSFFGNPAAMNLVANYCKSGNLLSLKERLEDIELEIW